MITLMISQLPVTTLENETGKAIINWLKQNNMLVNPKKVQVLFLSRKNGIYYIICEFEH